MTFIMYCQKFKTGCLNSSSITHQRHNDGLKSLVYSHKCMLYSENPPDSFLRLDIFCCCNTSALQYIDIMKIPWCILRKVSTWLCLLFFLTFPLQPYR